MSNCSKGDSNLGLALHPWCQHLNQETQCFLDQTCGRARSFFLYDRNVARLYAKTFAKLTTRQTRALPQPGDGLAEIE